MGQTASIESQPYEFKFKDSILKGITVIDSESGKPSSHRFTGLPFAQSTSGDHRFLKARPLPEDFDYSGDYTNYKAQCPQGRPIVDGHDMYAYPADPTEDVTYLNIWVPADDSLKPEGGWPVLVFIHGGWLQFGTPDGPDCRTLHGSENLKNKYILVSVGYRLNIFGFLSGKEVLEECGSVNQGFWDQRLGLEWVYDNIAKFGGNSEKITVGGLSAGSYSTFLQLAYEVYHPQERQIIKQVFCISNCVVTRQKTVQESQSQFDELCKTLGVDEGLSGKEKLARLREFSAEKLVAANYQMSQYYFRGISDNDFISHDLFPDIHSGKYGELLAKKGTRLIFTEVANEAAMYAHIHTPEDLETLTLRLENYYPPPLVEKILKAYPKISEGSSAEEKKEHIKDVYGRASADFQVYASIRTFLDRIVKGGFPVDKVHRYRTEYLNSIYENSPFKRHGVTHSFDMPLWWYAKQDGLSQEECLLVEKWIEPVQKILSFSSEVEGLKSPATYYLLDKDGKISFEKDKLWDWGLEVGKVVAV